MSVGVPVGPATAAKNRKEHLIQAGVEEFISLKTLLYFRHQIPIQAANQWKSGYAGRTIRCSSSVSYRIDKWTDSRCKLASNGHRPLATCWRPETKKMSGILGQKTTFSSLSDAHHASVSTA